MPPKRKQLVKVAENGQKRPKSAAENVSSDSDSGSDDIDEKVDLAKSNTRRRSGRLKSDTFSTLKTELLKDGQNGAKAAKTSQKSIENGPMKKAGRRKSDIVQCSEELNTVNTSQLHDGVVNKTNDARKRGNGRKSQPLPQKEIGVVNINGQSNPKTKNVVKELSSRASYGDMADAKINVKETQSNVATSRTNRRKNDVKLKEELLTRMKANVGVGIKRKGSSSDSDYSATSDDSASDFEDYNNSKRGKGKSRKKTPSKTSKRTTFKKEGIKPKLQLVPNSIKAVPKPELKVKMGTLSDSESDAEVATIETEDIKSSMFIPANLVLKANVDAATVDQAAKSESADSSESEWEEVAGSQDELDPDREPVIPKDGVEIMLEMPDILGKRRRREFDVEGHFRRKINRYKKRVQLNLHKTHLLCLLGHGIFVSDLVNGDELRAVALSIIPSEMFKVNRKKLDVNYLNNTLQWFRDTFSLVEKDVMSHQTLSDSLLAAFENKKVGNARHFVVLFVLILRVLHLDVRFVISLQPLPMKASDLIQVKRKVEDGDVESSETATCSKAESVGKSQKKTMKTKPKSTVSKRSSVPVKSKSEPIKLVKSINTEEASSSKLTNETADKKNEVHSSSSSQKEISDTKEHRDKHGRGTTRKASIMPKKIDDTNKSVETANAEESGEGPSRARTLRQRTRKSIVDVENSEGEDDDVKKESTNDKRKKSRKPASSKRSTEKDGDSPTWTPGENNSDSDFEVEVVRVRSSPSVLTSRLKKNRKIKDEDEGIQVLSSSIGNDYWIEVYLESQKKWICVDCVVGKVNCFGEMEKHATEPLMYVVAFDNFSYVKDVTRRYAENWMSHTRKLRVKSDWWEESLAPFRCKITKREKDEDKELEAQQLERPLPKTIGEFKSHPLYVLQRHLLKYEALYPPDVGPIGYIRKEAVYPRECVYTCYSRESWLRMAKTVKIGEKPYKIVKGRPRWNKVLKVIEKSHEVPPLEIFGEWQVEDYDPPVAVNGKVPRNEYGNVDLYKPCMLPKGCVHLQVPDLKRVAKKLGIDCAGAVIGWDKSTWIPGPLYDGYIVCEEFADTLMEAWREQQRINIKRQKEKRDKRVWGNWRRIIRGLLIRERIQVRYFNKNEEEEGGFLQESEDVPT